MNRSNVKRIALVVPAAMFYCASPLVATSAAEAGGADKPRPATFGDCKNANAGVHNGYDCEEAVHEEEVAEPLPEGGVPV